MNINAKIGLNILTQRLYHKFDRLSIDFENFVNNTRKLKNVTNKNTRIFG